MTTQTEERPWYEDTTDCEGGWLEIRKVMQRLATQDRFDGDEACWEAYARYVNQSLDQEIYGEFLSEGGWDSLEPMWDVFRSGWDGGASQYGEAVRRLRGAVLRLIQHIEGSQRASRSARCVVCNMDTTRHMPTCALIEAKQRYAATEGMA